jgi:GNAT superfamily N-acetyltransferase
LEISVDMVAFEDGSAIVKQSPHPAFDKILECGYRISFRIEQDVERFKDLLIEVLHGDNGVAEAEFTDDGASAYCQNVQVDPSHQRKGIATAIYVFAENVIGKPLYNFWGSDPKQTPAARALWAQPNRPFGRPLTGE